MIFAYLSQGRLFLKDGDRDAQHIESHFGKEVVERALRMQQQNEWKTRKQGTPFGGSMLWGVQSADPRAAQVSISGVTHGGANDLFFVLNTEATGGLFRYDWQEQRERRLFHKEHFRARDLDWHSGHQMLVGSQSFENGTANIIVMNAEGRDLRQLTEGDSVDEAPSWMPGTERRILFQSAGVARNQQGYYHGTAPFAIHQLDLDRREVTTLLEDAKYDFLCPRADMQGNLYVIRRPYENPNRSNYGIGQGIADFLLFPFRLLRAIFHFLNFFSMTFSQKPLTTASGPKIVSEDEKTLLLRGRVVDVQKSLREAEKQKQAPSLVPQSWELLRREPSGKEETLAKGVLAFDATTDGAVIYTNGSAIFQLDERGKPQQIGKGHLIEHLIAIR